MAVHRLIFIRGALHRSKTWQQPRGFVPVLTHFVTDINGCASCSTVTVNFSSGMENASDNSLISVYPVPFGEEFTLQFDKQIFANGNAELTITNLLGEKIGEMALNSATTMINTSKWDAGVYFISVRTSLGVITKKI